MGGESCQYPTMHTISSESRVFFSGVAWFIDSDSLEEPCFFEWRGMAREEGLVERCHSPIGEEGRQAIKA